MAQVTFEKLNPNAPLFAELKSGKYAWWEKVKANQDLYIEIRKDNNINVYYQGGSVIRLHYCSRHKKVQAFTHRKYLYGKGEGYEEIAEILSEKLDTIITNIPTYYSQKKGTSKEKWSETYIKGNIRINHKSEYIDSEFAYIEGDTNIQIDLVECIAGEIRFVELKRIGDARMVTEDMHPEILTQIDSYRKFIASHTEEILKYYQSLYTIKKDLGITVPLGKPSRLNTEPLLLIFDNWEKENDKRTIHREKMEEILEKIAKPKIKYQIINSFIVPKRTFYSAEQRKQISYYDKFLNDKAENKGIYKGKPRDFVLKEKDSKYNLFSSIINSDDSVEDYFSLYSIAWWGENAEKHLPTGHFVSSQIHCLNHLFALRHDKDAIKTIVENATGIKTAKVLPSPLDKDGYITFEFVFKNKSLLGEKHETRGANCTSIDALVYVELNDGKKLFIPIEWKYTETYCGEETREESFGRYSRIHEGSNCQKWTSLYRADPFYELMRQTLLVERIIKTKECGIEADDYVHIVVCPNKNEELLGDIQLFRESLSSAGKKRFYVIDPQDLLAPLHGNEKYANLLDYLKKRYWESVK